MKPLGINEIRRIEDLHHPRGYREWVGRNEKERRFKELCEAPGEKRCFVCHGPFSFHNPPTLEHVIPKGLGGSTHDDHRDNLALSHWRCNVAKGSKRHDYKTVAYPQLAWGVDADPGETQAGNRLEEK